MNNLMVDIIVGLQAGDEGKGKVTHHLLSEGGYTHCVRYNGGGNAGHTIYHDGKKFVTHFIPAGVFFGVKSIIGPGCVLDVDQFFKEIKYLNDGGIETDGLIYVSKNTHIIRKEHFEEDQKDSEIGTTKTGNGPAYRDKYARKGALAEYCKLLEPYLIDFYQEMHNNEEEVVALFEGAQGFQLDIDWGDYPYVTSSHCTVAGALLNGIPSWAVRNVWGVAKAYETYVGAKKFQSDEKVFEKIQEVGKEFGSTTGRKRQCNWINLDMLMKAIHVNGVTHLIFNKMDVLRDVGQWEIRLNDRSESKIVFRSEDEMKFYLSKGIKDINIYFSDNPYKIEDDYFFQSSSLTTYSNRVTF